MASFRGYKRSITLDFNYDEVKEGIPNVKRQMAVLNAEFRKSNAEADASGKSLEKLGVRYDYLSERIKMQRSEVEHWEKKLKEAQNATGNNTKAVQNNTAELAIAKAHLSQTQAELEKISKELDRQQYIIDKNSDEWRDLQNELQLVNYQYAKSSAEAEISGKTIDKLSTSHEYLSNKLKAQEKEVEIYANKLNQAKSASGDNTKAIEQNSLELARSQAQLAQTKAELDKVSKELEKNKTILGKTSDEWKDFGDKIEGIGKGMSLKVTAPLLAAATASFKLGADFEQALGKMDVVFENNSKSVENWSKNALKNFGLAQSTAVTMASDFGALFKGMGISLEKTQEWSTTLTERTMDLSNFYDTTVAETTRALNAIVTGQTEPLRRFGINMTQATLQEYAFSQGIKKKVADMTEAEKVQLRYNFVIERTNIAVGTTARESDTATGQMNRFKESVKELGTQFSEHILPVFIPVIDKANSIIEKISNLDDGTKKFIVTVGGVVAAVGPVLLAVVGVFKAISTVTDGMKDAKKAVGLVKDAGKLFKGALDTTQFFGFAKWAIIIGGVATAIAILVMAINDLLGKGNSVNAMLGNIGSLTSNIGNAGIRGYAVGSNYITHDQVAVVHKGEAIIPADSNPYNPNATRYDGVNNGGFGQQIVNVYVQADDLQQMTDVVRLLNDLKQTSRAGVVYG